MTQFPHFAANGRLYVRPRQPVVVICLDGCENAYLDAGLAAGRMPNLARMIASGARQMARSAMPSFTNPNNLSIATGRPSSVHGICGNFFLDPETGEEVMMNDARFLRVPTLFAEAEAAGLKVAVITAKDKLRALLGKGLDPARGSICFSSERADRTTLEENGIEQATAWLGLPRPEVYSADLSEFVFAAGVRLLAERRPDIMYLSTTDYIQHKAAPDEEMALAFNEMVDGYLGRLLDLGAVVVLTADHGMKPKADSSGAPRVIWLQAALDAALEEGNARVVLPITDPYVAHHGALGSYATVHCSGHEEATRAVIAGLHGIDRSFTRAEACALLDLPSDRIGDMIVTCSADFAIGLRPEDHDLSGLDAPLRSHGGFDEQQVPFITSRPLAEVASLRNYDAFAVACALAG